MIDALGSGLPVLFAEVSAGFVGDLAGWQWGALMFGAMIIGLSKTGIAGVGILFVALFALVLPSKQSVGVVLPLLICGDIVALFLYRRHAQWIHLFRLFPLAAVGVLAGYLTMDRATDDTITRIIGIILFGLCAFQIRKRYGARPGADSAVEPRVFPLWYPGLMGALAGFTTMVSNAAGPIMILYLLSMRLPKKEFLGTGAVFFLCLNLFKVPFGVDLGIINADSLHLNLHLVPAVLVGAAIGRLVVQRVSQRVFENAALIFTSLGALRLLVG